MIVVFGSINVDILLPVKRLPVRGETVLCQSCEMQPGGKGANQAAAAARCGGEVRMIGCVGKDLHAVPALETLRAFGVDLDLVAEADAVTGTAAVMIEESGENQIVAASGANLSVRADQIPAGILDQKTTLVLQMEVPVPEIETAIACARQAGSRVLLNLAPALPIAEAALQQCDVLVLNESEARSLADAGRDPEVQAPELASRFTLDCIITLGGDGAVVATSEGVFRIDALQIDPIDSVGAGDAFVGTLAAALDRGTMLIESAGMASVAGGLTCLRNGAQTGLPDLAEIEASLSRLAPPIRLA